jgi:FlaA1/EpsC-like NDP-sugar epimerase
MKQIKIIPRHLMILDLTAVLISVSISFLIRLGHLSTMRFYIYPLVTITVLALTVKPIAFSVAGLYRPYWGFVAWREIRLLLIAPTAGTLALIVAYLLVSRLPFPAIHGVPRSIFAIDWLVTLICVGAIRWIAHSVLRQKDRKISGLQNN